MQLESSLLDSERVKIKRTETSRYESIRIRNY